jgi:MFS family permease
VVAVQGGFIGPWSRKFGDRRLIYLGLGALAAGLVLTALTPRQPMPAYSRAALQAELVSGRNDLAQGSPATGSLAVELPPDSQRGWLGLGWILAAMVPAAIGGGILQPSINSLITKRIHRSETGGILGISAALLSAANAIAPLAGGAIFQVWGARAPFLCGGLIMATLLVLAAVYIRPETEPAPLVGMPEKG